MTTKSMDHPTEFSAKLFGFADQMDVEALGYPGFAAGGAIIDALADEPVEPVDGQTTPRHAGRDDDRPGVQGFVAVEEDSARFRVDADGLPGYQNLGAQALGLAKGTAGEFVAGNSAGR